MVMRRETRAIRYKLSSSDIGGGYYGKSSSSVLTRLKVRLPVVKSVSSSAITATSSSTCNTGWSTLAAAALLCTTPWSVALLTAYTTRPSTFCRGKGPKVRLSGTSAKGASSLSAITHACPFGMTKSSSLVPSTPAPPSNTSPSSAITRRTRSPPDTERSMGLGCVSTTTSPTCARRGNHDNKGPVRVWLIVMFLVLSKANSG
mmetsp:Transcript_2264/g.5375  ORF Transcript_2264/g.5375 Transcript_2264/m.5375 type:complete len:203 (-) Transcript_2264:813-1421(-)